MLDFRLYMMGSMAHPSYEALMPHCLVPASHCCGYQGSRIDASIKVSQPTADVGRLKLGLKIDWIIVMFP